MEAAIDVNDFPCGERESACGDGGDGAANVGRRSPAADRRHARGDRAEWAA